MSTSSQHETKQALEYQGQAQAGKWKEEEAKENLGFEANQRSLHEEVDRSEFCFSSPYFDCFDCFDATEDEMRMKWMNRKKEVDFPGQFLCLLLRLRLGSLLLLLLL